MEPSIIMRTDLKPCPFCGSDTKLSCNDSSQYEISCIDPLCGCKMSCSQNVEIIIQKWNRRYTGIQDKKGTKIFVGDLCRYSNASGENGVGTIEKDCVWWKSGSIKEKHIVTPLFYLKCSEEWEVIRSIYSKIEG